MSDTVVRIAARGDGVTSDGRHIPFSVPGDGVSDSGEIFAGPHHQHPPCRHFPTCGGCQLQHADDEAYAQFCADRVANALAQHGLETDVRAPYLSPPKTRRRATLRAIRAGGRVVVGFNEARSNRVVDLQECHILQPELFALLAPLRKLLGSMTGRAGEVHLILADQGPDLLIRGFAAEGFEASEALTEFALAQRLARLSLDEGLGPETRFEPVPVTITLSGKPVQLPGGAFLQATADGEAALVECVREAAESAERSLDLFAGIGTFALALSGQVAAAEASRDAALALQRAAPNIAVQHRDLYRRPFDPDELKQFQVVVLDPPRAGAADQVAALAASAVPRIAYVSCNPATFARDAKVLADGGYKLDWARPIGQFRWSTHVELSSCFSR